MRQRRFQGAKRGEVPNVSSGSILFRLDAISPDLDSHDSPVLFGSSPIDVTVEAWARQQAMAAASSLTRWLRRGGRLGGGALRRGRPRLTPSTLLAETDRVRWRRCVDRAAATRGEPPRNRSHRRRSPGRSLLRSTLPGRGRGGHCASTTGEPRGLCASRQAAGGPRGASLALRGGPRRGQRRAVTRTRCGRILTCR